MNPSPLPNQSFSIIPKGDLFSWCRCGSCNQFFARHKGRVNEQDRSHNKHCTGSKAHHEEQMQLLLHIHERHRH